MFSYKNISIFSKSFLILVAIVYFADFISGGYLTNIFALNPLAIVNNLELWRFVSFPLSAGSSEAILLFSFTFFYISSRLEILVDKLRYPIWLFTLVFLQGIVLTLIFWKSNINIAGMEGISIFVLTFYTLIQPKSKIEVLKFKPVPIFIFSLNLLIFWSLFKIISFMGGYTNSILPSVASSIFGLTFAILIYTQIKISHKIFKNKYPNETNTYSVPAPEELSVAMMSSSKSRRQYQSQREEYKEDDYIYKLSNDPIENEEKLNILLDKIFLHGKDSLSFMELKFLKDYSNKIQ